MRASSLVALPLLLAASLAGCIEAADLPTGAPDEVVLEAIVPPKTDVLDGEITFSATTPARTINNGGTYSFPLEKIATTNGYLAIVTWSAETPASQELQVWVREQTQDIVTGLQENPQGQIIAPTNHVQAKGSSPLRVPVDGSKLPREGMYELVVRAAGAGPAPVGVALTQTFKLSLTTFDAIPFDADYQPA